RSDLTPVIVPPEAIDPNQQNPGSTNQLNDNAVGRLDTTQPRRPSRFGDSTQNQPDHWSGYTTPDINRALGKVTIPPKSPTLAKLWRQLWVDDARTPQGTSGQSDFQTLRFEVLSRSGLGSDAQQIYQRMEQTGNASGAVPTLASARAALSENDNDLACERSKKLAKIAGDLPDTATVEALLLRGYCALVSDDQAAANLIATLARDSGIPDSPGLIALEAGKFSSPRPLSSKAAQKGRLSVVETKLWQRAGGSLTAVAKNKSASAEALIGLATDETTPGVVRILAAENAAKRRIINGRTLAKVYDNVASKGSASKDAAIARANLYTTAKSERTPFKKVRAIRAYLDNAKRAELYRHALELMGPVAAEVNPAAEITWFSETAIEAALVSGDVTRARRWISFAAATDPDATGNLDHWAALSDVLDPPGKTERENALRSVEQMALDGRFGANALHRLATVLDALNFHVPIPLWEAASRTPQPSGGHLPETGVLSKLQSASKERRFGQTVLYTMQTIGPGTAAQANMLALGDAIRALKRAGYPDAARDLGFEALFAVWPRRSTG
ncbi:MAG: hypothetical protein AAFO75_08640, partial [Pseudomonadota bacterium]